MEEVLDKFCKLGVSCVVFGDVSLEDVRKYRERNLSKLKMKAIFPMWKKDSRHLIREFINLGFKAIVTCADSRFLDRKFVGKVINNNLTEKLPSGVDPCGENGEFHSFVFDGPIFRKPVRFKVGKIIFRENRFWYCDLVPL
jgi:uncharacterized protein (TIGR00290 family)